MTGFFDQSVKDFSSKAFFDLNTEQFQTVNNSASMSAPVNRLGMAAGKALTAVGAALQPFLAIGDVTRGIIGTVKGVPNAGSRAAAQAVSHFTWGLPESKAWNAVFPGLTGAREQGVTGLELLKGTKYEKDATAGLIVEVLADPSILLLGAGAAAKGGATAGRLASLEKLAQTPAGAAKIKSVLAAANNRGTQLLRAADEVTGVPAATRAVAASPVGQGVKAMASRAADVTLPGNNPVSNAIRREGGGTLGDAFLTPDGKQAIYTPEQLARDEFRTGARLAREETAQGIRTAALPDAKTVEALTTGLSKADQAEVIRLTGVFTTTTDPKIAQEALRKLTVISTRTGKNLEQPFVAAVKATDRVGQEVTGKALAAEGLPVVLNPEVTKAIQEAQTGADLVQQVGKYVTPEGRPRGILMTQYVGRDNPSAVVQALKEAPPTPARAAVDAPQVERTLTASVSDLPPAPPKPLEPVEVTPQGQAPMNPPTMAERLTQSPVMETPAWVQGAARQPVTEAKSPAAVLEELFTGKVDAPALPAPRMDVSPVDAPPVNVARPVEATPAGAPPSSTDYTPAPRTPAAVLDELLSPPAPRAASDLTPTVRVEDAPTVQVDTPPTPRPVEPAPAADPAPAPAAQAAPSVVAKTPQQVLSDLLNPQGTDVVTALPHPVMATTAPDVARDVALPAAAPERTVTRAVPTTYRTVEVDANALDWGSLPDDSARRAVLNSIEGAGNARFIPDASGATRLDRPNLTVPLDHPVISRYFGNDELMAAQRQGTDLGERTITRREQVPDWFNPREGTSLDYQRAAREAALGEANAAAFPNDLPTLTARQELREDYAWTTGDAYASFERQVKPDRLDTLQAGNNYAARVAALTGTPPTPGAVFQYRLALARYRQAVKLRTIHMGDVSSHLDDFFKANPEATLLEGAASAARAFDLGREGLKHIQTVLRQRESGFMRELSSLEKMEFGQYLISRDAVSRGQPGDLLVNRLTRNPRQVSQEFEQVFAQDVNALKLLDEQVRTRTAAIVRAQAFRQYRDYLTETGQLITQKKLAELRRVPPHRLTPDQLEMRANAAGATNTPGKPAGWRIVDRNIEGYFQKGDVVPWWAYHDLFGAHLIDDAATSAAILNRGGVDFFNRFWRTMNAQMLGSPSSIINDQVGQFLQMGLWGVTPDAVIEGMIRRASATPEQIAAMRGSGIQSAKLEANLGSDIESIRRAAQRLEGDTDLSRMERVLDSFLRFRERGTGIDRTAMTGAAGVAADAAHLGSGYAFQLRSKLSDIQRESLYFHRIAVGDTPTQAAKFANDTLMDMRLVPAYAKVIGKYVPFFNWIAMSGPRSIVTVLRRPAVNSAFQRIGPLGDRLTEDGKNEARRLLARDRGYWNLGATERDGTRVYIDPRSWDPTNTIPQLLDWRGTQIGPFGLPWYANLVVAIGWGEDRYGTNVYNKILNGAQGGFREAYALNPAATLKTAAQTLAAQFSPSYAPGSSRAKAFVNSVIETAKLDEDGSRDIAIARTLTGTAAGRAFLLYMQKGNFAAIDQDLAGQRESPYVNGAPSVARAVGSFILPLRGVNADQNVQGDALRTLSVGQLELQNWVAAQRKRLQELESGGATPERLREVEDSIQQEYDRKLAKLDLIDQMTR